MALRTARRLVDAGQDRQFSGVERMFCYLPFEHAEDLAHQQTSLRFVRAARRDEPAHAGLLEWAQRHHDIVARFGRFPHRNARARPGLECRGRSSS
jgi:uncharacterized protein (DUF924 family)